MGFPSLLRKPCFEDLPKDQNYVQENYVQQGGSYGRKDSPFRIHQTLADGIHNKPLLLGLTGQVDATGYQTTWSSAVSTYLTPYLPTCGCYLQLLLANLLAWDSCLFALNDLEIIGGYYLNWDCGIAVLTDVVMCFCI